MGTLHEARLRLVEQYDARVRRQATDWGPMVQSVVYMLWALGRMSGWNDVDAKMQSRVFQPVPEG